MGRASLALAVLWTAMAPSARSFEEQPSFASAFAREQGPEGQRPPSLPSRPPAESGADRAARTSRAIERGLAWLAAQEALQPDGSFPPGHGERYVPVAVTALGALAYMAGGNVPDRGPQGRELSRAIDYLLARAELTPGAEHRGYISSDGDKHSRMHGHGFATLALAQAYGISPKTARGARTEEVLAAAVKLIEQSQGPEGGWYYEPQASFEHENSVTVCLVQALRGAQNAGVQVDAKVVAKAVDYVKRCQNEDGSFRYSLSDKKSSVALTAAGIATLNSIGVYRGPEIQKATDELWRKLTQLEEEPGKRSERFPHYERLYLAQALWQNPDPRLFERWSVLQDEQLLRTQNTDGSWDDGEYGESYATAMNCLVLAIPQGLLPIFQR
jgi:prenyltransferase/squalene oxidase-like repeat protein